MQQQERTVDRGCIILDIEHSLSSSRIICKQRGITLVEILIAFSILALISLPLYNAFRTTQRGVQITEDETTAISLAQKVIEDIRYNLYHRDSNDFAEFVRQHGEGKLQLSASKYFNDVFREGDLPEECRLNQKQLEQFVITVEIGPYTLDSFPGDPKKAQGEATLDIDLDGAKDPDITKAVVTVTRRNAQKSLAEVLCFIAKKEHYPREEFEE